MSVEWLRHCWIDVDIAAVERRFDITYREPPIPASCSDPEVFRIESARDWIAQQRHRLAPPRAHVEVLAKRLILAMLEPDPDMRALYVHLVRADIEISDDYFALAVEAARQAAAHFIPHHVPDIRNRLLSELDALVPA